MRAATHFDFLVYFGVGIRVKGRFAGQQQVHNRAKRPSIQRDIYDIMLSVMSVDT